MLLGIITLDKKLLYIKQTHIKTEAECKQKVQC